MSLQRGRGAGRRHIKEPFGTTVEFLLSRSGRAADQSKEKELEEWRHGDNMALGDLLSFIALGPDTQKLSFLAKSGPLQTIFKITEYCRIQCFACHAHIMIQPNLLFQLELQFRKA